jgi:hypothetical protein
MLNRQKTCLMFNRKNASNVSPIELESSAPAAIAQMAPSVFSFSKQGSPRR